jgi:hypothetical protein
VVVVALFFRFVVRFFRFVVVVFFVGRALFCCSVLFLPDLFVFFVLCYSGVRFGVVWSSVEVVGGGFWLVVCCWWGWCWQSCRLILALAVVLT